MNKKFIVKKMNKVYSTFGLLLLVLLLLNQKIEAQANDTQWAKSFGGNDDEVINSITNDNKGNIYACGSFKSSSINYGNFNLINGGLTDILLIKYDSVGNTIWAKRFGGTGTDNAFNIKVDGVGNLLMTGVFDSPNISFGSISLSNKGLNDVFLVKLDANGNVLWAVNNSNTTNEMSKSLAFDENQNVFLSTWEKDKTILTKYNVSGSIVWSKTYYDFVNSRVLYNKNSIVLCGDLYWSDNMYSYKQIQVKKIDINGVLIWEKLYNYSENENFYPKSFTYTFSGLTCDTSGNYYLCGSLDYYSAMGYNMNTYGFLVKLNNNGDLVFNKSTTSDINYVSISVGANNNIYVAGQELENWGYGLFDSYASFYIYNSTGNLIYSIGKNSASLNSGSNDILINTNGSVCFAGYYTGVIKFDGYSLNSIGNNDAFITSNKPKITTVPNPPIPTLSENLCGNKILTRAEPPTNITYYWQGTTCGMNLYYNSSTYNVTASGTYYLRAKNSGNIWSDNCASIAVTINKYPVPTVYSPKYYFCNGVSNTNLTAGGGTSYKWNNGETTNVINVKPITRTTYTVTVTDVNGCSASISSTIYVSENPYPKVNLGPDRLYCPGSNVELIAGDNLPNYDYYWYYLIDENSKYFEHIYGLNNNKFVVYGDGTYAVFVKDYITGCEASDTIKFNYFQPLSAGLNYTNSNPLICPGKSITLSAKGGGSSYLWNTGESTSLIIVNPNVKSTYSVTSTGECGTNQQIITVDVRLSADAGPNKTVCPATPFALTASGGTKYLWGNGTTNATMYGGLFTSRTFYVTVTNKDGCSAKDSVRVTVSKPIAEAGADKTVCYGKDFALTASGGIKYLWGNGTTNVTMYGGLFSSRTFYVTVTNKDGCSAKDSVRVTVSKPIAEAGADKTVCYGGSFSLTASGGTKYLWGNGTTNATMYGGLFASKTFYVTVTNKDGCSAKDSVRVTVSKPIAEAGIDKTVCYGASFALTASGGTKYLWGNGTTNATMWGALFTSKTFYCTVTNSYGCSAKDSVRVTVNPNCKSLSNTTSIADIENIYKISVYPNPARDFITIETKGLENQKELYVYNVLGELVRKENAVGEINQINISQFPFGIYYLRIASGSRVYNSKFVKE